VQGTFLSRVRWIGSDLRSGFDAFNFAIKKGKLLGENPISRLDFSERKKTEVEIIAIANVENLLLGALQSDLELLPFLTLGFFLRNPSRWRAAKAPMVRYPP
jgi:hypothetical protein